jgi:CheY-like chemotaxis protein
MVKRTTKCRVMIVEDDDVSCRAMRALLTRWGHDVEACVTTTDALRLVAERLPQCVILDLMLPDMNGIEVLRMIRRRELPVRVAVVTAAFDPQLMREVRSLKPDAVLKKPVDLTELKRWIEEPRESWGSASR